MNLQFYVEKLKSLDKYEKFITEFPDAYPCSGFFIIDLEKNDNKNHFDFYIPKDKKIFSFQLESENFVPVEMIGDEVPKKINLNISFDFNEVEKMIKEKMQEEKIYKKIQKLLFSLQKFDKKEILVGTIFISSLGIIKININLEDMRITDFEKKSFFDMLRVIGKKKL
ncbi:MAG: hypothetical protein KKF48_00275 [Nanoarchaeota archaeon]|nr:hypothetical protein [Nanoarchaeota archaeon]MBU1027460.1 hypothetical protein [Nanoarchaeota archaeon]